MTVRVILNPYSNRWNAQKRWPEAEAALRAAGVDFELAVSEHEGHLGELAKKAVEDGCTQIIAAGGDGTIGQIVNAIAHSVGDDNPLPVLGVLPLGTANDWAYALNIPNDLRAAAAIIAAGKVGAVDLGKANDIYFANNSALGLEPYVTVIQSKIGWIKGIARYLVAAIMGIMDKPTWIGHLEWENGAYDGPLSLVYVGNGPRSGGVFFMGPHADVFDGKLTLVYAYRSTRLGMFAMLPKTMKADAGSYVESAGIVEAHTSYLSVRLESLSPAHTDGELFTNGIASVDYRIFPGRLRVLLP